MNHLTLRGTHREMGFQWGARLAERGLRLLDHVPLSPGGGAAGLCGCLPPGVCAPFPRRPGGAGGAGGGQNCRQEDLETVLFTTYALPPACGCSCLAVSNGNGVFFGRNSDFLTALEPDYTHVTYGFSDRAIPLQGTPPRLCRWRTPSTPGDWPSGSPLSTRPGPGRV